MILAQHLRSFCGGHNRHAKSINGLCLLVQMHLALDPLPGICLRFPTGVETWLRSSTGIATVFASGRSGWSGNRFVWPRVTSSAQPRWPRAQLAAGGLDLRHYQRHEALHYSLAG